MVSIKLHGSIPLCGIADKNMPLFKNGNNSIQTDWVLVNNVYNRGVVFNDINFDASELMNAGNEECVFNVSSNHNMSTDTTCDVVKLLLPGSVDYTLLESDKQVEPMVYDAFAFKHLIVTHHVADLIKSTCRKSI